MLTPLRSRGAELDFWCGLQRQHSVPGVSGVSGRDLHCESNHRDLLRQNICKHITLFIETIIMPSNSSAATVLFVRKSHIVSVTLGSTSGWEKQSGAVLTVLQFLHKAGTEQKSIILKGQQHSWKHKAGGYPAAQLVFHCRWQSKEHAQQTNSKWHKIALYWQYWIPEGLQQQAITALYHMQFEITSFCSNGNVITDIFTSERTWQRPQWRRATQRQKGCGQSCAI